MTTHYPNARHADTLSLIATSGVAAPALLERRVKLESDLMEHTVIRTEHGGHRDPVATSPRGVRFGMQWFARGAVNWAWDISQKTT